MINQPFKQNKDKKSNKKDKEGGKKPKFNFYWIYVIVVVVLLAVQLFSFSSSVEEITWQKFKQDILQTHEDVEKLVVINKERVEVYIKEDALRKEKYQEVSETNFGFHNDGPHYYFTIGSVDVFEENLDKAQADFKPEERISVRYETRKNWGFEILSWVLPILILVAIWIFIMRKVSSGGMGGAGSQIFNIGKSKAKLLDKDDRVDVTFNDVAGLEEAKAEVEEVVDFLKNPKHYTSLGGKIPKGVLLIGPPGTGKTLLAKATAGEAKVPFFSMSGSDFVEMFVGVGASRVRDLFKQAREKAPCIIFIDEIDAIGKRRGQNIMQGGNDERENTLNQLLTEMDGFSTESGVIILAATNQPDVLDSALLRPGRFDRQIMLDRPDRREREAIFKVHIKPLKLAKEIDLEQLAALTPGFAGAEIANVCNEAALIAARKKKKKVEMSDFQDAIDRVIGGLEKKNKIISPEEKRIIAYHETGHALVGWFLKHADPLVKVSIIPRGMAALGYAQYLPKEKYLYTKEQLLDTICMALGGRAAEEIIFGEISTGAQNDLERITRIAYDMITVYGMDDKIGHVSFRDSQGEYSFKDPYSDETAELIDAEVRELIQKAYKRTKKLLKSKRSVLEHVAQTLLDKEVLFKSDLEELIGHPPIQSKERQKDGKGEPIDAKAAEKEKKKKSKKKKKSTKSANNGQEGTNQKTAKKKKRGKSGKGKQEKSSASDKKSGEEK